MHMQQASTVRCYGWYVTSAIVLALIFISRMAKFVEPDFFMHLRIGQWICENRTVPSVDVFSHIAYGRPWTDHEWLFQVLLYLLHRIGGWPLLAFIRSLLLAASYFFTVRTCRLLGLPWSWSLALTLIAAAMAMGSVEFRPQVVTYFLFPLYFEIMLKYLLTGRGPLWLLPLLIIPWANMHGAFLAVFVLGALLLIAETAKNVAAKYNFPLPGQLVPIPRIFKIGVVLLVSFVATVINPYGSEMWLFPFKVIQHPIFLQMIFEWMPPEFPFFTPFWVVVGVFLVIVIPAWRSLEFRNIFLILAWTYLSLSARRNIVLFGYVAAPLFGQTLWQLCEFLRSRLRQRLQWLSHVPAVLLFFYSGYLVYAVGYTLVNETVHEMGVGINSTVPTRAADFILQTKPAGEMFNEYNVGGYLIYRLFPHYKVFQDGRVDVYGPELFYHYKVIESGNPTWRKAVKDYNLNFFVLTHGGTKYPYNLASQLDDDPEWTLVYFDDLCLIYVRNSGPNRLIAKLHGYKYIKPGFSASAYLNSSDIQTSALPELDRAIATVTEARLPRMLKLYCLTSLGRYDEASSVAEELLTLAKNKSEALYLRGRVYALEKNYEAAIAAFKAALALAPSDGDIWLGLGDVYEALGRNDEALKAYLRAAEYARLPEVKAYMSVARVATRLGNDRLAMHYWDKYLLFYPADIVALNDAGTLCLRTKNYTRAISFLKKAVEAKPDNAAPYYNLACAYVALGDQGRALNYLKAALALGDSRIAEIAKRDADLAALRSHPDFFPLLAETVTSHSVAEHFSTVTLVRTGTHD
ncbi:MAG: tetratricopeptide repeat protein [Candidatus Sumerlaeaceae bacterium]